MAGDFKTMHFDKQLKRSQKKIVQLKVCGFRKAKIHFIQISYQERNNIPYVRFSASGSACAVKRNIKKKLMNC